MTYDPREWSIEDAINLYQINRWGDGYFSVSPNGDLTVLADRNPAGPQINIQKVIEEIQEENIGFPVVIRFHDILRNQVKRLNESFIKTIEEANYQGKYYGVFPIKVNQLREVVDEIVDVGQNYYYGLEAGSKAEILTALAMNDNEKSLTVLNGYKDKDFMRLALLGRQLGRKTIIVIEKFSEIKLLLQVINEFEVEPIIGVRAKLNSKGSGKWAESTGDFAKFGLSIPEIVDLVNLLKEQGKLHWLQLFHFHVGSQIPDIRTIKECITEGARIYVDLKKMGAPIEFFDVGGGLGVNYDGSLSSQVSSVNYTMEDYIGDVVYILRDICDWSGQPHPNIVTESGRTITAHHSCVVTNVFGNIEMIKENTHTYEVNESDHNLVKKVKYLVRDLTLNNYQDTYNDACIVKEEAINGFKLGVISLEERSIIETIYTKICHQIMEMTKNEKYVPLEIKKLNGVYADKYLCNFSVFQSTPDTWAIGQILPIVPITRLNECPTNQATLGDITCDSDGKINCFISPEGPASTLPVHELRPNETYTIGLFMTGAYQDIMGDMHNLFGRLNEVHVFYDDDDPSEFYIEEVVHGHNSAQVLQIMQYTPEQMCRTLKRRIDKKVKQGHIKPRLGVKLTDFYEKVMYSYTYLNEK